MPVNYGYGLNPYPPIILILIVLQWFRVSGDGEANDLTNNGGLFIIALFSLVYCSIAWENARVLAAAQAAAAQARCRRGLLSRLWY